MTAPTPKDIDAVYTEFGIDADYNGVPELVREVVKVRAERDEWKRRYFVVADAVAPSSENAADLASIARSTRAERDAAVRRRREIDDEAFEYAEQIESLTARLAACERDAARYRNIKRFDGGKIGMTYNGNSGETTFIPSAELDAWCDSIRAAVATAQGEKV